MADGGALYYERMVAVTKRYNQLFMVVLCVPLTLCLRVLFGPARHLPEIAVFSLYVVGHGVAITALLLPALVRFGPVASMSGTAVYVVLAAWAAVRFWDEGWSAAARAAAAMIVSYIIYTVIFVVFVVIAVFGTALSESGLTWGQFIGRMIENTG